MNITNNGVWVSGQGRIEASTVIAGTGAQGHLPPPPTEAATPPVAGQDHDRQDAVDTDPDPAPTTAARKVDVEDRRSDRSTSDPTEPGSEDGLAASTAADRPGIGPAGPSTNDQDRTTRSYDVALSFANEQRPYVERVAAACLEQGIRVFYDMYEKATLWGKDLYQHLAQIYSTEAHYCVVFVSASYPGRAWAVHEQRSAQERAFWQHGEYILPVIFDETRLPGLPSTLGYIDARTTKPTELAQLIQQKLNHLGPSNSTPTRRRSTSRR